MVFVDTSAWFAAVVPSDPNHRQAASWLAANSEVLITTDYVIDEILTLLRARGERQRAKLLGKKFFDGSIAEIYFLTEDHIRQAWAIFEQYHDKNWSFTDCSSKVLIDEMNIADALAFDRHFHQFGTVHVVPEE
jgi:predicted nucleic acid-binding protein